MLKGRASRKIGFGLCCFLLAVAIARLFADNLVLLGLGLWVARFDHRDIEIVACDEYGRILSPGKFFRTWRPALIARDSGGSPRFAIQHGLGSIRVAVPSRESVTLEILWPVPGFGKVLLTADNGGRGFDPAGDRDRKVDLVPELARSRIGELRRWVAERHHAQMLSPEAERNLAIADSYLRDSSRVVRSRLRAAAAYRSLRAALFASEQEVLAEANDSIERNRRATMKVTVLDRRGKPIANRRVQISNEQPDFLFGAFDAHYDRDTRARMRSAGLDYATLLLDWRSTEPLEQQFEFNQDLPTSLRADGFTVRGHALVWLANGEMPSWMNSRRGDRAAVCAAVKRHVDAIVCHYRDTVQIWEANNEGHAAWARWGLNRQAMIEVVRTAAQEIRRHAPRSEILINLALPLGEDVSLKYYPFISPMTARRIDSSAIDPYVYAAQLQRAGVPYDLIGLQFYNGCWVDVRGGIQVPAIDLFRFATVLERYERLGKPIQITEVAAPSLPHGDANASYWHGVYNSHIQAEYLAGVFTIAYGDPLVRGVNWWDFYDRHAFADSGGLFNQAFEPKESYVRLRKILNAWRSEGEVVTDARGVVIFRGPPGRYRITAVDSTHAAASVHLEAGRRTLVMLKSGRNSGPQPDFIAKTQRKAASIGGPAN